MAGNLRRRRARTVVVPLAVLAVLLVLAWTQGPGIAAGALLVPARRQVTQPPPRGCSEVVFANEEIRLRGWRCPADGPPRGTLILLHGVADNRIAIARSAPRFTAVGLDVIAYDSRAHGNSDGEACTYGFFEKHDLRRVIDTVDGGPVVLLGTSLGAAIAMQEAADDARIAGVVAAEVFSDLRTIARDRVPLLPQALIDRALVVAEQRAGFRADEVDVVAAARRMTRPVLLIHGAEDRDTRPEHSRRVYDALAGPRKLLMIDGAGHNQSLGSGKTWSEVVEWVRTVAGLTPRDSM